MRTLHESHPDIANGSARMRRGLPRLGWSEANIGIFRVCCGTVSADKVIWSHAPDAASPELQKPVRVTAT